MIEKNPVPDIGKGIVRPHACICPPVILAFTSFGRFVWLSCNQNWPVLALVEPMTCAYLSEMYHRNKLH